MQSFITTAHLDYFQRQTFTVVDIPDRSVKQVPEDQRRQMHIRGIGRFHKKLQALEYPRLFNDDAKTQQSVPALSEDLIIGLFGYKIPLVFDVIGSPQGVCIQLGTWTNYDAQNMLDEQQGIISTALNGIYPAIDLESVKSQFTQYSLAGFALGIPTVKLSSLGDGSVPWDRLIRALSGTTWRVLILAEPVSERSLNQLRHQIINEMRMIGTEARAELAPNPLARFYNGLLQNHFENLTKGQALGAWRTAVYLLGDHSCYYRLASLWRGIFSGEKSHQEPVQIWDHSAVTKWAANWSMPDIPADQGPGNYHHPFQYQSLLTSPEVAAYIHLPHLETGGFSINLVPNFDTVPPLVKTPRKVHIGKIRHLTRLTQTDYQVSTQAINRHVLIVGVTGSGKTTTGFYMLKQLWRLGIPFLVIEPAKTEYRALLSDPEISSDLNLFTLGNEQGIPFRFNPFEFEPGVSLSSHIDLLKSVFNAAFSMWTVLPQVLEQSLYEVYREYGWDIARNRNKRLTESSFSGEAYPTLTDLQQTISKVVDRLGYEPKTTSEIKAALITRLQSLRIGGKGKMLDTRESFPIAELLSKPTILELEEIGDDDEKAFLMGLILVRLYEYLRSCGSNNNDKLRHLVVVEEAHRLLANIPAFNSAEVANTRGKAVETFVNMLSEVRAYGEGFLIAEQIPSKLAPDVIKNTNIKIVHRTVAGDDRELMRQTMNMNEHQSNVLGMLKVGEAAVFSEGDDQPILVKIPEVEKSAKIQTLNYEEVKQHHPLRYDCHAGCRGYIGAFSSNCAVVEEVVETAVFQDAISRYILSVVVHADSLRSGLPGVLELAQRYHPGLTEMKHYTQSLLIYGITRYLNGMGQNYQWSFKQVVYLRDTLIPIVLNIVSQFETAVPPQIDHKAIEKFRRSYQKFCIRNFDPFLACAEVCAHNRCLYRYHTQSLLDHPRFHAEFVAALKNSSSPETTLVHLRDASLLTSTKCFEQSVPQIEQNRLSLCYAVQKINNTPEIRPALQKKLLDQLIELIMGGKQYE